MRLDVFVFTALVVLGSFSALAAEPLPQGEFAGTGRYLGPQDATGTYAVTASVEGGRMVASYVYKDAAGQERRETLTLTAGADGSLAIESKDQPGAGRGRCDRDICSYAMTFPGGEVMELIRFKPDAIEKVGTKRFGEMSVTWTETLARVR